MTLLQDPNILVSMINMKLRDGAYDSLSDVCLSLDIEKQELCDRLSAAGFKYDESVGQFR